jgi:RHS repeat-associated protein
LKAIRNYTWDGENRLRTVAWSLPGATLARATYTYDGYSRRVLKLEERKVGAGPWMVVDYLGFVYDGWNHIMTTRLNENHSPRGRVASYVWGPDIGSGFGQYAKRQSAGGVGGLCMVLDGASTAIDYPANSGSVTDPADDDYFPLMDRMGNVTGYRKAAAAEPANTLAATYDYDAFGQEIRCVGPASDSQPYRFSTKFTEGATGLVYYGYRWYDAGKGRWVNRDPIGEAGGENLYGMVDNDAPNSFDKLGLFAGKACCWLAKKLTKSAIKDHIKDALKDELKDSAKEYLQEEFEEAINPIIDEIFSTNLGKEACQCVPVAGDIYAVIDLINQCGDVKDGIAKARRLLKKFKKKRKKIPQLDDTGKLHGPLPPEHAPLPPDWTDEELDELADEIEESLPRREEDQLWDKHGNPRPPNIPGEPQYRERQREERRLLDRLRNRPRGNRPK